MINIFLACAALMLGTLVQGHPDYPIYHGNPGHHAVGSYGKKPFPIFTLLIFGLISFLLGYVIEVKRCNECARKDAGVSVCDGNCEPMTNLNAIPVCTCKELF